MNDQANDRTAWLSKTKEQREREIEAEMNDENDCRDLDNFE